MRSRIFFATATLTLAAFILGFSLWQSQSVAQQQNTPTDDSVYNLQGVYLNSQFELTDHKGVKVTEKSWPGQYLLVFFGFTHCPSICPTALQKISDALEKAGDQIPVQPLFITTDPGRDTVEQMSTYVGQFNKKIIGLTGSQEQIDKAINGFRVYASKVQNPGDSDYTIDHSSFLYLLAPDGGLVSIFNGSDSVDDMARVLTQKTATN